MARGFVEALQAAAGGSAAAWLGELPSLAPEPEPARPPRPSTLRSLDEDSAPGRLAMGGGAWYIASLTPPEVQAVFDEIKRARGVDDVNAFWKALAVDPATLRRTWDSLRQVMAPGALDPLTKELLYIAVSATNVPLPPDTERIFERMAKDHPLAI